MMGDRLKTFGTKIKMSLIKKKKFGCAEGFALKLGVTNGNAQGRSSKYEIGCDTRSSE